jgi:hypothetical protein
VFIGVIFCASRSDSGDFTGILEMGLASVLGTITGTILGVVKLENGTDITRRALMQGVLLGLLAGVPGGLLGGAARYNSIAVEGTFNYDWDDLKKQANEPGRVKKSPQEEHEGFQAWAREQKRMGAERVRPQATREGLLTGFSLLLLCVLAGSVTGVLTVAARKPQDMPDAAEKPDTSRSQSIRQRAWIAAVLPVFAWISSVGGALWIQHAPAELYILLAAAELFCILGGLFMGIEAIAKRGQAGASVIIPATIGIVLSVGSLLFILLVMLGVFS